MQFPTNTNPGPHSPTLSNGSKAKRVNANANKSDKKDKIQKMRRLDSPTSPTDRNFVQVPSPQYSTLDSGKYSPKMGLDKMSPKGLYPPSIQKYLNGKTSITIRDAVDKLKSPTNKTHKTNLEKMQMLGMLQTQEIETNIMFRKAYSNSTSVSPARSNSPIESPKMTISPKVEPSSPIDNIVMTFEESSPTLGGGFQNQPNINYSRVSNNNPYNQAQQQGFYNNHPQGQLGYNNQNFQGNQGFQGMHQQQQYNQNQQFNSFNQQPAYFNNQGQQGQNQGGFIEEETRDRTTSFLMEGFGNFGNLGMMNQQGGGNGGNGVPDTKWMAQNQLNQIHSLVQTKKTISPGEPSRGMAQLFQKRNSNPENLMRTGGPQPLFPQKNQSTGMNNAFQGFNNNNNMFQQGNNNLFNSGYQPQVNSHQLQQKLYETGMVEHGHNMNQNQNQGMSLYQNNQSSSNLGDINFEFRFTEENNPSWTMNNPFDHHQQDDKIHQKIEENEFVLDPSAFLGLKESIDFDMNIIPSNVGFIPGENTFEGLNVQANSVGNSNIMDSFLNNNQY